MKKITVGEIWHLLELPIAIGLVAAGIEWGIWLATDAPCPGYLIPDWMDPECNVGVREMLINEYVADRMIARGLALATVGGAFNAVMLIRANRRAKAAEARADAAEERTRKAEERADRAEERAIREQGRAEVRHRQLMSAIGDLTDQIAEFTGRSRKSSHRRRRTRRPR